jgi:hypothetical protein
VTKSKEGGRKEEGGKRQEGGREEGGDKKQEGDKRWHQQPTIWVSVIALIVSLIASLLATLTAVRSSSANLQFQEQTRLTTLIQQLSEMRERIAELPLQYGDRAPIPSVELRQPLIEEALRDIAHANSFQKMVIAESLNETNQPDRAEPIAGEAESEARNLVEVVLAAQVHAVAYFNQGKAKDGRQAYSRALKIVDVTPRDVDPLVKTLYQLETEQFWISSELRINNCSGAKERLRDLELYSARFPRMLAGESERRVQPTRALVFKICP